MKTRVQGTATLTVMYDVVVNKSMDEIEAMSQHAFNELIDDAVDWHLVSPQLEPQDFDVDDMTEVGDDSDVNRK